MKSLFLFVLMMLVPVLGQAADDPILFTVGDMAVTRSEFEQSYLKTISYHQEGRQSVADFLDSYIVYKLKVKAALDAHIDATTEFQEEYARCLSETPVQPIVTTVGKMTIPEAAVNHAYDNLKRKAGTDGQISLYQIFMPVAQKASREELRHVQQRMENVYRDLQRGADFGQMAQQYSQDRQSAQKNGAMGWFSRGQLFKEIEDVAFSLGIGEMSRPFLSTVGYHILLLKDRKPVGSYEQMKDELAAEVGQRQIHRQTTANRLQGDVIERKKDTSLVSCQMPSDPTLRCYYEGLLLFEQSKHSVGRHAAEDEDALKYFFKKNKKKYRRKGFKPKDYTEVRELVVADLQDEMNKHWIADLRKQYPVRVNKKVLKTVNKHQ